MTEGFIGPDERRVDRLDLLITEALRQMDRSNLSDEAQQVLADLESEDALRRERARRRLRADGQPTERGRNDNSSD